VKLSIKEECKTFLGIKIIANNYIPDDCLMVSPKMLEKLKAKYGNNYNIKTSNE